MTPSAQVTTPEVERTIKEVTNAKVRGMARSIAIDPALNEGVLAMMGRASEMRSPLTALLAGIAALPQARRVWEDSLDQLWDRNRVSPNGIIPEVVIGAGLHSAIYCGMCAEMGRPVPVVLEAEPRAGGIFATSRTGTFFLNSRNRPGNLSIPGSKGALNFLPGSMVQPADVSGEEYQVNSDLAFAIRSVFAMTGAKVVTNARVERILPTNRQPRGTYYGYQREYYVEVRLADGRRLKASRVIVATGIGKPKGFWSAAGERLLRFRDFMASLDSPFPLRGMQRIAVIGAGDSGKTVVEALTGQGPTRHMSVASLDYPDQIVWYGQESTDRASFEGCNRPRYKRLGTLLEGNLNRRRRVRARTQRVNYVTEGYNCVLVDGEPYDLAIDCTGYDPFSVTDNAASELTVYEGVARLAPRPSSDRVDRIFYIGPAARLPRSDEERLATPDAPTVRAQREAEVAVYRYAGRTAQLAKRLATA